MTMKTTRDIMVCITPEHGTIVQPIAEMIDAVPTEWSEQLKRTKRYEPVVLSEMDGDYCFMLIAYDDFVRWADRIEQFVKPTFDEQRIVDVLASLKPELRLKLIGQFAQQ